MENIKQLALQTDATTTGNGEEAQPNRVKRSFFAVGTVTAGAGSVTILIEVSNDGTNWLLVDTLTLTIASSSANGVDGFYHEASWLYSRMRISAISGTNATVNASITTHD